MKKRADDAKAAFEAARQEVDSFIASPDKDLKDQLKELDEAEDGMNDDARKQRELLLKGKSSVRSALKQRRRSSLLDEGP